MQMAGTTKFILLMTLAAVCFLPQDGVDAIKCHQTGKTDTECKPPFDKYCQKAVNKVGGQEAITKGCAGMAPPDRGSDGCVDVANIAKSCFCDNKDLCNSSNRLHGQSSSVLSLCIIVFIFLAISFFGKP